MADVFSLGWDDTLLRLAVAALLGGAIGLERELDEKAAGLRTHMLVASGAALFTLVGAYGFSSFLSHGKVVSYDPSRIAAATASMSAVIGRSSRSRGDSVRTTARVARTPTPGSSGARNSTPCAPARSSIAIARSQFASTCHAFSPAAFPIET